VSCNNCEKCCNYKYSKLALEYSKFREAKELVFIAIIFVVYYFLGVWALLAWAGLRVICEIILRAYADYKDTDIHSLMVDYYKNELSMYKATVRGDYD
jgi:hypothetical protein